MAGPGSACPAAGSRAIILPCLEGREGRKGGFGGFFSAFFSLFFLEFGVV